MTNFAGEFSRISEDRFRTFSLVHYTEFVKTVEVMDFS